MTCAEMQESLPAYADGEGVTLSMRRHLSRCPECRGELERYTAILSGAKEMRAKHAEVPEALFESLVSIPASGGSLEALRVQLVKNRKVVIGGAAVAAVGAAGAALLWRKRRLATA